MRLSDGAQGAAHRQFAGRQTAQEDVSEANRDALIESESEGGEEDGGVILQSLGTEDLQLAKWGMKRKFQLGTMLLLLVLLGSAETVTYIVNGKKTMVPYRCFLNQLVVFACVLFFFGLDLVSRRSRKGACSKSNQEEQASEHDLTRRRAGSASSEQLHSTEHSQAYSPVNGLEMHSSPSWDEYDYQALALSDALLTGETTAAAARLRRYAEERAGRHLYLLYFVMASCDTVSLYVSLLASHNISGSLRLILQQLSIPLSMLFSYVLLGRSFSAKHIAGAVTVFVGVGLCMINIVEQTPGQESSAGWSIAFAFSCLPLALGGCLKEWVLVHTRSDPNRLNAWISMFQLMLGFLLVPVGISIQNIDVTDDERVEAGEILENFFAGAKCGLLGIVSYDERGVPLFDQDSCAGSVVSTWLYFFTVCSFNLLMLWVIREGTAVLFFVANGVIIPLVSMLSASRLYEWLGLHADKFTPWQALGLCLTMGGCIFFGAAMIQRSERDMEEQIIRSATASSRMSSRRGVVRGAST